MYGQGREPLFGFRTSPLHCPGDLLKGTKCPQCRYTHTHTHTHTHHTDTHTHGHTHIHTICPGMTPHSCHKFTLLSSPRQNFESQSHPKLCHLKVETKYYEAVRRWFFAFSPVYSPCCNLLSLAKEHSDTQSSMCRVNMQTYPPAPFWWPTQLPSPGIPMPP